jgi:hypothetical protein
MATAPIEIFIPPDDLSLTIPEEQTEFTDWYADVFLVDENGDQLVDENGNLLVAPAVSTENVYVLHIPPDDLSVTIPEEV